MSAVGIMMSLLFFGLASSLHTYGNGQNITKEIPSKKFRKDLKIVYFNEITICTKQNKVVFSSCVVLGYAIF